MYILLCCTTRVPDGLMCLVVRCTCKERVGKRHCEPIRSGSREEHNASDVACVAWRTPGSIFFESGSRETNNLLAGFILRAGRRGAVFETLLTQFRLNLPRLFGGTRMAGGRRFMRDRRKREAAGL